MWWNKSLTNVLCTFSCDQAAIWTILSFRPSACHCYLAVFLALYHYDIFQEKIKLTKWCPYKRSRSEDKAQGHGVKDTFASIWAFPGRNSNLNLQMAMKCDLLFFKISHKQKIDSNFIVFALQLSIHRWLGNDALTLTGIRWDALLFFHVICLILRSHWTMNYQLTRLLSFQTITPVWIHM